MSVRKRGEGAGKELAYVECYGSEWHHPGRPPRGGCVRRQMKSVLCGFGGEEQATSHAENAS